MNFKYKLKENSININDEFYIDSYLKNLGIENVQSFIEEPDQEDYIDPKKIKNLEKMVDELYKDFNDDKIFYLQPDADADGYTSAAIFYRYFKNIFPNAKIEFEMHEGKEHGIKLDKIPIWVDVVVIPDAGSNDFNEQEELSRMGKKVYIIDHHEVEGFREVENVIVCNNQLSNEFKNKDLSGAGMVYKLINLYSNKYHDGESHKDFLDLAAIGGISDMMDSRQLDNNYIFYHGLRNIKNPLVKELLIKQSYSISSITKPNKIDIAFYITPLINGLIRAGSIEENENFFNALIDYENTEEFLYTFRGNMKVETLYEKMARESYNIRNKQNKLKEKAMQFLDKQIQENNLDQNSIITVVTSKDDEVTLPKTMTGLVAMEFVKKYKKPTLVLRPKNDNGKKLLVGSGRANPIDTFNSFKDELNESNLVEYAQGHGMAFGCSIEEKKIPELTQYFNEKFSHIDFGSETIDVDYAFEFEDISNKMMWQFAANKDVYGNKIPLPKFAFKFIMNNDTFKVMGQNKNTFKIVQDGVTFIKFFAAEEIKELTEDTQDFLIKDTYEITIIGRPQLNEFNGNCNLQIIVENFHAEKYNKRNLL